MEVWKCGRMEEWNCGSGEGPDRIFHTSTLPHFHMVGYSSRTLAQKLGLKDGHRIAAIDAPEGYWDLLAPLPDRVEIAGLDARDLDFIHFFARDRAAVAEALPELRERIAPNGM